MKTSELKAKAVPELNEELLALLQEQFKLRMQKGTQQLTRNHLLKEVRRNIARVKTILREKVGAPS